MKALKQVNYIRLQSTVKALCIILFIFASLFAFAQNSNEDGLFDIRNYTSKEYSQQPQNFAIVQDLRGVLYFGNNSDILEYDGEAWNTIKTPLESAIHSLAITKKGVIYVGGTGEIGYLMPDSIGKMRYHSLLNYISKKDSDFADVWKCIATDDGLVYFQASNKIFCWDGKNMQAWTAESGTAFHLMFYVRGTLYVRQKAVGLAKMVNSNLALIQGGDLFAEAKMYMMLPFHKKQILISIQGKGLFMMTPGSVVNGTHVQTSGQLTKITPFHTQIDTYLANSQLYSGIRLNNWQFSIGTHGSGIVVIDSTGKLFATLTKKMGLQDESVNDQFIDAEQKLWLATNTGITKVDINSPITKFNDQNGLEGTVQTITRHEGKLYAVTDLGVYYLQEQNSTIGSDAIEQSHFIKVPGIADECWDLLPFYASGKSLLLAGSTNGIFSIEGGKSSIIANANVNVLHRSIKDSNRIFIGSSDGVSSIYWNNGTWVMEGKIEGISNDVHSIEEESNGTLWLGGNTIGVIRVKFDFRDAKIINPNITQFDTKNGLPEDGILVKKIKDKMLFAASASGLYKYKGNGKFSPDSSYGKLFANGQSGVLRIDEDHAGNIWVVAVLKDGQMEVGYLKPTKQNKYEWIATPFMGLSKAITFALYHDLDGVTWLGGPDGIYRYDNKIQKNYNQNYNALIRKVMIGKDSMIFSGSYFNDSGFVSLTQPDKLKPTIKYKYNSLVFRFSAPDFEDESAILYSYYLEGFDNQWSAWKHKNEAVYTNLPEGQYFFRVKAQNMFGHESKEAVYEFTILSPWYRTVWAYIGYVLFFIAFVYGAISVSTQSLKKIISERTAEVVKQKEVIELKNKDITDSINYAKRIQEAILPTRAQFKNLFPDSFFLFKPKDIVSGDFFWLSESDDKVLVAAADCTGHGVPGAMMSVVCSNALNRAVKEFGITEPAKILDKVRDIVLETVAKSDEQDIKDGMDISICSINTKTNLVEWSGANNSLYYIHNRQAGEITADKQPIGKNDNPKPFTNHLLKLQKGDAVYLFTDGYADQFGGPYGKKFMRKRFKELLFSVASLTMTEQWRAAENAIVDWQGTGEQIDDILVIGVRI